MPGSDVLADAHSLAVALRGMDVLCLVPAEMERASFRRSHQQALCPPVLFARGDANLLLRPGVGISGARNASALALDAARDVARELASCHLQVVSGGAAGVDLAAHTTALAEGGHTTVVLPEGIAGYRLRGEMEEMASRSNLLMVSEFHPRQKWRAAGAMQRNRTICGISDAVLIIEARSEGGTFSAGQTALKNGVPLFVLEFGARNEQNEGNRLLLDDGAIPVRRTRSTGKPNLDELLQVVTASPRPATMEQLSLCGDVVREPGAGYSSRSRGSPE